jgi:hypothetical protein
MEYINISHKRNHDCKIHAVSSEQHETYSVFNILQDAGYWCSRKSDENIPEYIILDLQKNVTIDYVEIKASPNGTRAFPEDIRFEGSLDGECWMVLYEEKKLVLDSDTYRLDIPLTLVRYLKILIITSHLNEGKFYSEIGRVRTGIAGISEIKASSVSSSGRVPQNLLFDDPEEIWESELKTQSAKESLFVDLGKIFHVNRIILGSASRGFPENFYIETSSDNNVWMPLLEEKNFKPQVIKKYFWNTDIRPARYLRIEAKGVKYPDGKYGVQLAHLEISAAPFNPFHTHNIGDLTPYASIFQAGIVRFAKDGDDAPGIAVQANDRRLRDATTIFKGIVQLAEDGDTAKGLAVQASDSRIAPATDLKAGIVRLAHNRENKPGVVVQGNDSRLQEATTVNFGIVKLCPDGMYKENAAVTGNDPRLHKASTGAFGICKLADDGADTAGAVVQSNDKRLRDATTVYKGIVELAEDGETKAGVVVQGNDKRLKDATTSAKGIVELADNGEDSPGVAVQGNDRRLKDATTSAKGIVELAEDGETKAGVVVQGNDRRLKDATTTAKGIVELAEDGEDSPGVAVQGNDRRIKNATEQSPGIVTLARDNETKPGCVVQSNDQRLSNARTPLPHTHDYAPVSHDHNSHSGTIAIRASMHEPFTDVTPPSDGSAVIFARNESPESGSVGLAGVAGVTSAGHTRTYGVVGHSGHVGVRGQSSGGTDESDRGCGVLGVSRFGAGGIFVSEHGFSLVAEGHGALKQYDESLNLTGNGDALLVNGRSVFNGTLHIHNKTADESGIYPSNLVEIFEIDDAEYVQPGDILVVSEGGRSILSRARTEYNRSVIGVVSGNPTIIINTNGTKQKAYPVALTGTVLCRIDARQKPVRPGDPVVTSSTPGCGMGGVVDSFDKIGTVIGKALDALDDGIALVPVFISHS